MTKEDWENYIIDSVLDIRSRIGLEEMDNLTLSAYVSMLSICVAELLTKLGATLKPNPNYKEVTKS